MGWVGSRRKPSETKKRKSTHGILTPVKQYINIWATPPDNQKKKYAPQFCVFSHLHTPKMMLPSAINHVSPSHQPNINSIRFAIKHVFTPNFNYNMLRDQACFHTNLNLYFLQALQSSVSSPSHQPNTIRSIIDRVFESFYGSPLQLFFNEIVGFETSFYDI